MAGTIAVSCYSLAFALKLVDFLRAHPGTLASKNVLLAIALMALTAHAAISWQQLTGGPGLNLSLIPLSVLVFLIINLIVVLSAIKTPMENLYLVLFPATTTMLLVSLMIDQDGRQVNSMAFGLGAHILLSITSYSLMTIAALQALLLAWQNRQLHHHHPGGRLRTLPPLETMEQLLFRLLIVGFVLLSGGLLCGAFYVDDFFAQHLAHKTVFSIIAWVVYAMLLWGHYRLGWRGKVAIYWTLGGFCALMLAFWGTKFVLEVVLV